MQRVDPFFILILFIFSTLLSGYFAFDFHLSGVAIEKQKVYALESKIQKLQLSNEALQLMHANFESEKNLTSRKVASIQSKKEISLDEIYKSQLQSAVHDQDVKEILSVTKKISQSSADNHLLAQALYENSRVWCQFKLNEEQCFTETETLISQFPESKWAGEALLNLYEIYMKLRKYPEAAAVIKTAKLEFSKESHILQRISELEKKKL